jgi:hypothetical protein
MDYSGPEPADFANVAALNRAFMRRLRSPSAGERLREGIPASLRDAVKAMTDNHLERLAESPFLLLSLREHDAACWSDILADEPVADLFANKRCDPGDITIAASSFLWQLARRNPYATRLVSGAGPDWCERLGNLTLQVLLERVVVRDDILQPRFAGNTTCWQRLLGAGLSSRQQVREFAHVACLQTLLTDTTHARPRRLRAAACSRPIPVVTRTSRSGQT